MSSPRPVPGRRPDLGRIERPVAEWVAEAQPSTGLPLYLAVLRSRLWFIVLLVLAAVGSTALVVKSTPKVYKARADLLATALPREQLDLFGLGIPSESGDPTRDIETVAQLITTPPVAERVRSTLHLKATPNALLKRVSAQPVAQSNVISVTAKAGDPKLASRLANEFGSAAIAERTARLRLVLDELIPRLQRQLANLPQSSAAVRDALATRLQNLEALRSAGDPTLHLETLAIPPTSPSSPRPVLSIAAAFLGGLVLGIGGILGMQLLNGRVMLEEELRRYRVPILARIPLDRRRRRLIRPSSALLPGQLDAATADAYRRLASSIVADTEKGERHAIFITGPAPSMGKTTTAINLAASLAHMDEEVVLVEADSRRPQLNRVLTVSSSRGVESVVSGELSLSQALEHSARLPSNLRVLPQESSSPGESFITGDEAETLVDEAERVANWVIFDGPALNYAPEPLPIAMRADKVLVVVRLGGTRQRDLTEFAELLVQHGITPSGFIVLGGKAKHYYY